jgi:hypothetical protein
MTATQRPSQLDPLRSREPILGGSQKATARRRESAGPSVGVACGGYGTVDDQAVVSPDSKPSMCRQ